MLPPREIIARSWAITKKERTLRHWGYAAAFFETTRTIELLMYQAYYMYWFMQGKTVGWLSVEMLFFKSLPLWLFITVTTLIIILFLLQLFIPTLASGAIIGLAAKAHMDEERRGGLILALSNFMPILELHGIFIIGDFISFIVVSSFAVRYGGDMTGPIIALMIFLWILGILFHFFASFSEEGVVIRRHGVFGSIGRSFKMILSYLGHIVFLMLLLFVIGLRVLINVLMIILVPVIAIGIGLLFAWLLTPTIGYIVGFAIGGILIFITSYFFAYLMVFMQTVWTITYMELSKLKDLDVIEEEG